MASINTMSGSFFEFEDQQGEPGQKATRKDLENTMRERIQRLHYKYHSYLVMRQERALEIEAMEDLHHQQEATYRQFFHPANPWNHEDRSQSRRSKAKISGFLMASHWSSKARFELLKWERIHLGTYLMQRGCWEIVKEFVQEFEEVEYNCEVDLSDGEVVLKMKNWEDFWWMA